MNSIPLLTLALLLTGVAIVAPTQATADTLEAAKGRVFELPATPGAGDGKEVVVLIDDAHLKLATVALRGGTALAAHSAPVPTTIQVLEGEGVIHIAGEAVTVAKGTIVALLAGEEHDVVPAPGSNIFLLVHYLRSAVGTEAPSNASHEH